MAFEKLVSTEVKEKLDDITFVTATDGIVWDGLYPSF